MEQGADAKIEREAVTQRDLQPKKESKEAIHGSNHKAHLERSCNASGRETEALCELEVGGLQLQDVLELGRLRVSQRAREARSSELLKQAKGAVLRPRAGEPIESNHLK